MTPLDEEELSRRLSRACALLVLFLALTVGGFYALSAATDATVSQSFAARAVYQLGGALLLAWLAVQALSALRRPWRARPGRWRCPLAAAGLSLCLTALAYAYLGVWPLGSRSAMLVDMHHQYAPMLSELRYLLLYGGSLTYSTHMGLGTNFAPAFAYYLASPFNVLLLFFPERLLAEGILLITLLKVALAAGTFAACAQALLRRRNAAVVALAVLYAGMQYMLAYSWNIMWLDAVALLPLVVLFFERMLHGGRPRYYIFALALTLLASYYISFMVCVFLVLLFLVWLLRCRRSGRAVLRAGGRFAVSSLLAGGLAACLLIPTALALGRTSAAGGTLGAFKTNFALFDGFSRLFYGVEPTIRSGNLPNLYCGVAAVLLLPIYLTTRQIPLRRRLCGGGLLALLLLSCTVEPLDLLWHGLHAPNDLPYRFSFLFSFWLLLLAGRAWSALPHLRTGQIFGSLAGAAAYLLLWERFGGEDAPPAWLIYGNLLLLALYAVITLAAANRRLPARLCSGLLLLVVAAELLLGNGEMLRSMDTNEHYTEHASYTDNADNRATDAALRRVEALAAQAGVTGYRTEYLPRTTCMDTALHHYRGLTTFASSNPYRTTVLMGRLGYAVNGVNSYLYHSFLSTTDSLFGLRYVVLNVSLTTHPQLTLVDSLSVDGENRYIYENRQALPLGYCVSNAARQYAGTEYDPFTSQEQLYTAMSGQLVKLYEAVPLESESLATICNGSAFTKYATENATTCLAVIPQAGRYYAYADCRAAESISLEAPAGNTGGTNSFSVTTYEPYIIDLGELTPGQTVRATITGTETITGHIYVMRLDEAALETQLTALAAGQLEVESWTDSRIRGTVVAQEEQDLLLTLPYDSGWHATVDGRPVRTFPVASLTGDGSDGALLGVEVSAGRHTVELHYRTPGGALGWTVSGISAAVLLGLLLWPRWRVWRLRRRIKA